MDDNELLEQAKLLPLAELVALCSLLAPLLCRLYWYGDISASVSARGPLATLLAGLVDRDARRRFCPPSTWLVPDCSVTPLLDLANHAMRLMEEGGENDSDNDELDRDDDSERGGAAVDVANLVDSEMAALLLSRGMSGSSASNAARYVHAMRQVLRRAPYTVPFQERVRVFEAELVADRKRSVLRQRSEFGFSRGTLRVNRGSVFEDAYEQLRAYSPSEWRTRLSVQFVSEAGTREAGIDGGGLTKEFLLECVKQSFGANYALFVSTAAGRLYPNPDSDLVADDHLKQIEFLGSILGKALYEGILVELPLASFFLGRLLGRGIQVDDLRSLDEELYRNLLWIKHTDDADSIDSLDLDFTVTRTAYGRVQHRPLCARGSDMPVTVSNRVRYVHLMAHNLLSTQIREQTSAFERGLSMLIKPHWLRMFARHELQLLISGADGGFDVDDLQANCQLQRFGPQHEVVHWFFDVVRNDLNAEQQGKLLLFATGCSRPPLLGFGALHPPFTLARQTNDIGGDASDSHLPSASSCFNVIRVPTYSSRQVLRDKLIQAIESAAGFELS